MYTIRQHIIGTTHATACAWYDHFGLLGLGRKHCIFACIHHVYYVALRQPVKALRAVIDQ